MVGKIKNISRTATGIENFDSLIEGGLPMHSCNVLFAKAGCGKTIFSMQYLVNGANMFKEKGIYFSFEEKRESLIEQAKQFGWDIEKLEKKNLLKIISLGTDEINSKTIDDILQIIKDSKSKRVVVDSISTLSHLLVEDNTSSEIHVRKFMYQFISKLYESNVTSILISQEEDVDITTIAKYVCDGVIHFEFESMGGDYSRTLSIEKMRRTKNNEDVHSVEISKEGIKIHMI